MLLEKRAQALLEFAIIFPLVVVILFGIYEIGIALSVQQTITYAAREGARAGALTNQNYKIESAIRTATEFMDKDGTRTVIQITPEAQYNRNRGDTLTIKIEYTLPLAILYFLTEDVTLTSQAIARIEV